MSGLVVDASVVVAWLFDDEDEPRADAVLEQLAEDGALVPHLWHLETRNCLLTAERRGRLSAGEVKDRLDALKGLATVADIVANSRQWLTIVSATASRRKDQCLDIRHPKFLRRFW